MNRNQSRLQQLAPRPQQQQPQPQYQQQHEAMLRAKHAPTPASAPAPVPAPAAQPKAAPAPKLAPPPAKAATKAKRGPRAPEPIQARLPNDQRDVLKRYIEVDDQIVALKAQLKQLTTTKAQLESQVATVLKPLSGPVQEGNAILRVNVKNSKKSITKPFLIEKLKESGHLREPERCKELVEAIYKSLGTTQKEEIVRK